MPATFRIARRDAAIYRQWARWMLGLEFGPGDVPSSMTAADALFRQEEAVIRRVAATFAEHVLADAWGPEACRQVHRGLRLEEPGLHGQPLPHDARYSHLRAVSFSESHDVACFFADTGSEGLFALPIPNPVTGKIGLPPHGYVGTAVVSPDDVLLHWRYVLGTGSFFTENPDDLRMVAHQQEVTVRVQPGLTIELQAFHACAGDYIARRYPGGVWEPAPVGFFAD